MKQWIWLAISAFLALSCSSGSGDSQTLDTTTQDALADVEPGDATLEDAGLEDGVDTLVPCSDNWVMEFFGIEDGTSLEIGETYVIQARIYNAGTGAMVSGETVTFALEGSGDAEFQTASGVTNEYGVAQAMLSSGSTAGTDYVVTIAHRCLDDQSITLHAVAPEYGTIIVRVTVAEDVTAAWPGLSLNLYMTNLISMCGGFDFTSPTGGSMPVPTDGMTVQVDDALASVGYIAAVVATNAQGLPVGGGCTESIVVLADRTVEVDVHVESLNLDPVGQFDVTVEADIHQLLGEAWSNAGAQFAGLFADAGDLIADKVLEDLLIYFPDGFPEACGDVSMEIRGSILLGFGANFPPPLAGELGGAADALMVDLLDHVSLVGTLDFQETETGDAYDGKLAVTGIELDASLPCGGECVDLLAVGNDVFNFGEVKLDLEDATFLATPDGFEEIGFDIPTWTVRPGKLFLYVFTNIVMPAYGAPASLDDYLQESFVCQNIMAQISYDTVTCLNKPQQSFVDSCNAAVGQMWADFYNRFPTYLEEQYLEASATLTLSDGNSDLAADALEGTLTGTWFTSGNPGNTFSFTLSAQKD